MGSGGGVVAGSDDDDAYFSARQSGCCSASPGCGTAAPGAATPEDEAARGDGADVDDKTGVDRGINTLPGVGTDDGRATGDADEDEPEQDSVLMKEIARRDEESVLLDAESDVMAIVVDGDSIDGDEEDMDGRCGFAAPDAIACQTTEELETGRKDAGKGTALPRLVSSDLAAAPEVAVDLPLPAVLDGSPASKASPPPNPPPSSLLDSDSTGVSKRSIRTPAGSTSKLYPVRLDDDVEGRAEGGEYDAGRVDGAKVSQDEALHADVRERCLRR